VGFSLGGMIAPFKFLSYNIVLYWRWYTCDMSVEPTQY
jgi:hypothetical protein